MPEHGEDLMTDPHRILVIDSKRDVHDQIRTLFVAQSLGRDYRALAEPVDPKALEDTKAILLTKGFEVDSAYDGEEGIERSAAARTRGSPFSLAMVELETASGLDGIETARRLWEIEPDLQVVLTAQDFHHSWSEIASVLRRADNYLLLRKPFQKHELLQVVYALTEKWSLKRQVDEANARRQSILYDDAPAMFLTLSLIHI